MIREFQEVLEENILGFWMSHMIDDQNGGFYGAIDTANNVNTYAEKGAVLNARILWTFAAAYRILGNPLYLKMAWRAYNYIDEYFVDRQYGGVYWSVDYKGVVIQNKKQTYAQGFMLYAFSEFYKVTGEPFILDQAIALFECIEKTRDPLKGGYREAFTRDWKVIDDMRLSEKDENMAKTMNTHLHVLEPYTNLLKVWTNERLMEAQKELITLFVDKIYNPSTGHLGLFFDDDWNVSNETISFGHNIEAVWLLWLAANQVGYLNIERLKSILDDIATSSVAGLQADGSMIYEVKEGEIDTEKHWWVQAETVVGYMYAGKITKKQAYIEYAYNNWNYIKQHLIDWKKGEWYWSRLPNGSINESENKGGFWKCPYHNGRMCMEMLENLMEYE